MNKTALKTGQERDNAPTPYGAAQSDLDHLVEYLPAQLRKGAVWYVEYYARHPIDGQLKRKRIKIMRVKNKKARLAFGNELVRSLNKELATGWNPFLAHIAPKAFTPLADVIRIYLDTKCRDLSPLSVRAYRSYIGNFAQWCHAQDLLGTSIHKFHATNAREYLQHLQTSQQIGPRTFNNYLIHMQALFNWAIEFDYVRENIFNTFRKKKAPKKSRVILSDADRLALRLALQHKHPMLLRACLFVFHALVRPTEATKIKGHMIDLKKQVIILPPYATKSKRQRTVALPDVMFKIDKHLAADIKAMDPNAYLFSTDLKPGRKAIAGTYISSRWDRKARPLLKWGNEFKIYSLRDTGIVQKFRDGLRLHVVMKLADHRTPEQTAHYLEHVDPDVQEKVLRDASGL